MSDSMDKDVFNMNEINKLMEDMFDAGAPVNVINDELKKMGGSLETFVESEQLQHERLSKQDEYGRTPVAPYHSKFDGAKKHSLNGQQSVDREVVFEPDDQNSSLAGVKNITGIEDIHDFFAVGRGQKEVDYDLTEIDEQTTAMQKLSEGEKRELDKGFVRDMGMDLQRIREVSGATSAWKEIQAISIMLDDMEKEIRKTKYRFDHFIDLYVKDKIPK